MELFYPLYGNLWKFILSITRNRETAKDILSETVLIAYEKFETLKNEQAFLSYLFTIASRINSAENKKKSKIDFKENFELEDFKGNYISPEDATDINILYKLLDRLPEKQKEAIILLEIFGFSRKEIADIQNTNITNVKIRLYRGRKYLDKLINEDNS